MSSETLFVWIYLPDHSSPVVAGKLDLSQTPTGAVGRFVYGRSYIARSEAIPIDPVSLPLKRGEISFTALSGFPGVILDACPDRWGVKVIDRIEGRKQFPQGYILMNDPGRSGCLAFSTSSREAPKELSSREYSLPELLAAAQAVESDLPVDPELLKALHPGTGGARPKCNIVDGNGVWIAKFPSMDDDPSLSIPRLEHAIMTLGQDCGINTAQMKITNVDGKDVCLVRRFDRIVQGDQVYRRGFLSARTVFYADPGYPALVTGSYARLSRWMPRYGCPAEHRREVFRRMVFNCAVRNTDDHELNHGLVHVKGNTFELSPAYDVVPELTSRRVYRHALLIGKSAAGTVENLVGNTEAFGIERDDALSIVAEIEAKVLNKWRDAFYGAGFGDEDLRKVEHLFKVIPPSADSAAQPSYQGVSRP